jgi:hypothetical protein
MYRITHPESVLLYSFVKRSLDGNFHREVAQKTEIQNRRTRDKFDMTEVRQIQFKPVPEMRSRSFLQIQVAFRYSSTQTPEDLFSVSNANEVGLRLRRRNCNHTAFSME